MVTTEESTIDKIAAAKVKMPREGFINSIWADITGGVVTVLAAIASGRHAINSAFYQNIKIIPKIGGKEGLNNRTVGKGAIMPEGRKAAQEHFIEVGEMYASKAEKRQTLFKGLRGHYVENQKKLDEFLAEKYGITNAWHRFNILRRHQKLEVATKVGATMAVTLGAVATVAALRQISNDQYNLEGRLDKLEDQHQR